MADSGSAALDDMIRRCRQLGAGDVGARIARAAAPLVDQVVKKTAAAGQTPMGQSWKPKVDGTRPLVHAAEHITTEARGPLVAIVLRGKDVWHHKGSGGKPRRQVIPDGVSTPAAVHEAVLEGAKRVFRQIVGK